MTDQRQRSVIAVVDDDQRVLESLALLLDSADYDVRVFSTALGLLKSDDLPAVDCLISDVAMPVMDGVELARAVQLARPELPVILITGRTDLLRRPTPAAPLAYRVFKKPFNGHELLTAVDEALRDRPLRPRS